MVLGRKGKSEGERMTALVVAADHPLDNMVKVGKEGRGAVRIVVETGSDPIRAANQFKLDKDHWLVPGQEIQVSLDPNHPDDFEVDWDAIPSIEKRVAANDPTLTDPLGTQKRMEDFAEQAQPAQPRADRFKEAMEKAAGEPAPAGKQRAVVLVATRTATLNTQGGKADGSGGHTVRTDSLRGNDSVLSVNVPGMAPYAVFEQRLKRPHNAADVNKSGFPALVSSTDPTDIEILWGEVPSGQDQVSERIGEAMKNIPDMLAGDQAMMGEALKQAGVDPNLASTPPPAPTPGAAPQLSPQQRQMMEANAKQALKMVPPAQRAMLIQQYRMAGIEIDEADLD
jgi:hypothetical protein